MATTDWFVDNGARAYPFLSSALDAPAVHSLAARMPLDTVLDAQVIFGVDFAYDAATYTVWLYSVERVGADELTFTWRVTAPADDILGGYAYEVVNTITVDGTIQESRSDINPITDESPCGTTTTWEMQLIFGPMTPESLDSWIEPDETIISDPDELAIEPGCVQSLYAHYSRAVALSNAGRTRATADNGDDLTWLVPEQPYYTAADCLDGAIRFVDGHNAAVDINATSNSITLNARVGAGAGEACEEIARYDGDIPPAERDTLDGGLRCNEVLRSFNGLPGRSVVIQAGDGVRVDARPDEHKLVITVGVSSSAGCHVISDDEVADSIACAEAAAIEEACAVSNLLIPGNVGAWYCQQGRWVFLGSNCVEGQRPINPAAYGVICGSEEFPEGACHAADCD